MKKQSTFKNILYCEQFALTFISNPKVACSTIKNSLLGGFDGNVHKEAEIRFCAFPSINSDFFCITRNPYSRALSCFKNKIGPGKEANPNAVWHPFCRRFNLDTQIQPTFERFLTYLSEDSNPETFDMHYRPQEVNLYHSHIKPSFTGRIELFKDIKEYLAKHHVKIISRNTHGTGAMLNYKSEISKTEAFLIENIYSKDFEAYGYKKDLFSEYIPETLLQKQHISDELTLAFTN